MGQRPSEMPAVTMGNATKPAPPTPTMEKTTTTAVVRPKTISLDFIREGGNTVKGMNSMLTSKGLKRASGLDTFGGDDQEGDFDKMAKGAVSLGKASGLSETTASPTSGKTVALGALADMFDIAFDSDVKTAQQFKGGFDNFVKLLSPKQKDVLENSEFVKSYLGEGGNLRDAAGALYEDLVKKRQSSANRSAQPNVSAPMKTEKKVMLKVKKA